MGSWDKSLCAGFAEESLFPAFMPIADNDMGAAVRAVCFRSQCAFCFHEDNRIQQGCNVFFRKQVYVADEQFLISHDIPSWINLGIFYCFLCPISRTQKAYQPIY